MWEPAAPPSTACDALAQRYHVTPDEVVNADAFEVLQTRAILKLAYPEGSDDI